MDTNTKSEEPPLVTTEGKDANIFYKIVMNNTAKRWNKFQIILSLLNKLLFFAKLSPNQVQAKLNFKAELVFFQLIQTPTPTVKVYYSVSWSDQSLHVHRIYKKKQISIWMTMSSISYQSKNGVIKTYVTILN